MEMKPDIYVSFTSNSSFVQVCRVLADKVSQSAGMIYCSLGASAYVYCNCLFLHTNQHTFIPYIRFMYIYVCVRFRVLLIRVGKTKSLFYVSITDCATFICGTILYFLSVITLVCVYMNN